MTTQYTVLKGLPNGLALDAGKLFTLASPDTVVTGNTFSFSNRTNANTQYVVSIVRATPLPAGDYTFIAYIGTSPKVEVALTFTGVDGETATETPPTVELDPAARVKLDASQPDYDLPTNTELNAALAASDDATLAAIAAEAIKTAAIKTKTDNLPSDPADQSLIIAATDAVMARLGAPAGASISADVAAVKVDTGHLVSRITANLFSGITYMSRWLGALAGKTADTTTRTEINATTAGAGYNETTDSQEAIRDRGDAAWSAESVSPALVVSPVYPGGKIVLKAGDDYSDDITTTIRLPVSDASEAVYNRLTDSSTSGIKFAAGRNRQKDLIVGTVTKASVTKSAGITYVPIQIARSQITSAKVFNDYKYDLQVTTSGGKVTTPVVGELEVEFDNAE